MENTCLILSETADHWPALMIGPPGLPTYAENTLREPDHRARCASMERICTENAVPYFDILSVFPTLKNWRVEVEGRDGAHPGADGYTEMAAAISGWPAWLALVEHHKS